jgi:ribosomal-protein-alanine N-acetyltransferase
MNRAFLIGKKVYLRPFDIDDLEGNYLQWVNDGEILQHLASNAFPKTKEDLSNYVNNILSDNSYVFFAVIEKSTETHIGNVKIGPINWIDRRTAYGRMMSKESWGKGYGSEVLKLIIQYVFDTLNLNRIIDYAVSDNIASIKSNVKAGMELKERLKNMFSKMESIKALQFLD